MIVSFHDKVSKSRTAVPDWPLFPYSQVVQDPAKMLLDELSELYLGALAHDSKRTPSVPTTAWASSPPCSAVASNCMEKATCPGVSV